jgi:signal transduction histidine kinase
MRHCFLILTFFICLAVSRAGNPVRFNPDTLHVIDLVFKDIQEFDQAKCFELIRSLKTWNQTLQNDTLAAEILRWEGYVYVELDYKEKVEECLNKCIQLSLKKGLTLTAYRAMLQLDYFYSISDYVDLKSDSLLLRAIPLCIAAKDTTRLIRAYDNLGFFYFNKNKLDLAFYNYTLSDSVLHLRPKYRPYHSLHLNFANYYRVKRDFVLSEKYYLESKKLIIGNEYYETIKAPPAIYAYLGDLYFDQKKYSEARQNYLDGIELGQKFKHWKNLVYTSQRLSTLESTCNNFKKALEWQKLSFSYQDSLNKSNLTAELHNQEVIWKINQNELEYNKLAQTLASERKLNKHTLLFLLLTLALIAALAYLYAQKKSFNKKLQTEVQLQTAELQSVNRELERFNFAASHDIRTPIRNIISFIGLLERKNTVNQDAEAKEYVQFIRTYAYHLNDLVHDMNTYSHIGKGEENQKIEAVNLNETLQKTLQLLDFSIKEKNAVIECSQKLPTIKANKANMVQLFHNLIENSLVYNQNEQPRLSINIEPAQNGQIRILFSDNGIGIEPQYQHKIFNMFTRLHGIDKYPGTGLGLSICKKLVEQIGGTIGLRSSSNHGSVFYIDLPNAK